MNFKQLFRHFVVTGCIVTMMAATACSQNGGADGGINKQAGGTLLGGGAGALVGAQFGKGTGKIATTALGTLAGAVIGNQVGASLDKADVAYSQRTSQTALENNKIGVASQWQNPDTGNSGTITPTSTYQSPNGAYCREYTQTIMVGGQPQNAYGKACRQPDGTWKIVQ